ncbi:MAG: hypothetical protein ACEQSF_03380 [Solirubrobacteraceae bacterium]
MPGQIKIFHSETVFLYKIDKEFCKVYFEKNQNYLTLEIESTEDLDHVEEDSIQNKFPKIILSLDDFEINYSSTQEMLNETLVIEEKESLTYSKLSIESDDFKILKNKVLLTLENQDLSLSWKGKCEDFTQITNELLNFEVFCEISEQIDFNFDEYEEFEKIKEKKNKIIPNQSFE